MWVSALERFVRSRYLDWHDRPFAGEVVSEARQAFPLPAGARILYLQHHGKLGDALVALPVVRAVREAHPGIRSHLLLSRDNEGLRPGIEHLVDHTWSFDRTPGGTVRVLRGIRRERYDVIVDFRGGRSASSTFVIRWCRPRHAVGFLRPGGGAYTHGVTGVDPFRSHIVERNARLLLPFGIDPGAVDLSLDYRIADREAAAARARLRPTSKPLRLGINVSSSNPLKYWGTENFIPFVRWVQAQYPDLDVSVCGAPAYAAPVAEIASATGAWNVGRMPSFHDFAAVLHEFDLLLTPDSVPVHLAAAWKTPALVLYFREFAELPWYPYRSPYRAVFADRTVAHIPVADVQRAFGSLVQECFPDLEARVSAVRDDPPGR
jgi:ADP-heptose:LPS heptosyltransferase